MAPRTTKKKHPGHLEYRNGVYCVRLCIGGKRYTRTLAVDTQREAQAAAKSLYTELRSEQKLIQQQRLQVKTLEVLLADYETIALPNLKKSAANAYQHTIKPFRSYFLVHKSNKAVHHITEADIEDYITWRRHHRLSGDNSILLSNRTLQKDRTVLHTIFAFAKRRKYCTTNPVADTDRLKVDKFDPVILTDTEYEQLLQQCVRSPMLYAYVHVLGEAGLRSKSEALHLRWSDISFETGFLKVVSGRDGHTTKSRKSRFVPMTERLQAVLQQHVQAYQSIGYAGKPSPYVFHHIIARANNIPGQRIKSLYRSFKEAAHRANLSSRLRVHDLRHRRVTTWLAAGHSPVLVQQAMGHADIKTTMGYYQFLPEHLRPLVEPSTPELAAIGSLALHQVPERSN